MSISIVIATVLALAVAAAVWYASNRAQGLVRNLGQALSGTLACAAVLFLVGGLTASMYNGRPFGLEILKRPYELWIERFEHPTRPLVASVEA